MQLLLRKRGRSVSSRRKIRVLIVDDHPVVRAGLRTIAEVDEDLQIVAEAGDAAQALIATRELFPDVLLLDIRLPDQSGYEVCRAVKQFKPAPSVLFLTSFADNALVLNAMEAGADGYLLKENEAREIACAIRIVMDGGTIFDPVPQKTFVNESARSMNREALALEKLSPQELRVLAEVVSGKTDKEIASALQLQTKTVRHYLDSVFEKLGVNTRTHAALIWSRNLESVAENYLRKVSDKTPRASR